MERKNPSAVIEAFEKVCAARPGEDIHLAVKLMSSSKSARNTGESSKMAEAINQSRYAGRITLIDQLLTDNEIKNLVRCADCFVSLHRSEGFGKGAAEAMYLGKPVIATAYGGNLDFMNLDNSLLVRYKLIPVKPGQYLHTDGQVWADPDIDQAQYYMLKLLDDPEYGRRLGQTASRYIRTFFSYRAVGLRYRARLDEILSQRRKK